MLVWCPWMGVQLPKIVRMSAPHTHAHTHTVPSVHRGGQAVDSVLACSASQGQQPKLSFAAREISRPSSVGIFLAAVCLSLSNNLTDSTGQ